MIDMLNFKKIIVVFWTVWLIVMLWTDVVGGLAALGWLHRSWAPNTNYPFLVQSLAMYPLPAWVPPVLYVGITVWEFVATLFFIRASMALVKKSPAIWIPYAAKAFIVSLSFWFAFFIADQLVMKFELQANHMIQGGMMFINFLGLYLLPHNRFKPHRIGLI